MNAARIRFATLLALALSLTLLASSADAGGVDPARTVIKPTAKLVGGGRMVRVTGQVTCASCARLTLAVTVSQRTGALAQGGARCACHGATEHWAVTATVRQTVKLRAGPARICTWVIAHGASGKPIDAYQWCRSVTLG